MGLFDWLRHGREQQNGGITIEPPPPPLPPPGPLPPSLEIFSRSGHGRSSFLMALLFQLRRLNLVWPNYLCWPQDELTEAALKQIHEHVHHGRLPVSTIDSEGTRYDLLLQGLERWGRRRLVVWDRPDPVLSQSQTTLPQDLGWQATACWLLSLADLSAVDLQILDMTFDDLMRARRRTGHDSASQPLRLVVVLTKADALPDLPLTLRRYLKEDNISMALSANDGLLAESKVGSPLLLRSPDALQQYLIGLWRVHEEIQRWMETMLSGQMLVHRAREHHVELRFAIVSATGSGLSTEGLLQIPWSPRRVLDPLFWALELDSSVLHLRPY